MPVDNLHNALAAQADAGWSSLINNIPSVRSLSGFALSAYGNAQALFGTSGTSPATSSDVNPFASCSNPQLSCHNTSVVEDLCCFNAPGGTLLQTQFWDTHPVTGPQDSWTIHGLWPDNCDGTYEANCDDERAYRNITAILRAAGEDSLVEYMQEYWVSDSGSSETFWEHEWGKHGTCISTLDPQCYADYQPTAEVPRFFNRTVSLFQALPSYQWLAEAGIVPDTNARYTRRHIEAALSKNHGGHEVYLGCRSGALNEIWYFFNIQGSLQTGTFEPADVVGVRSTCPGAGIKYLPKGSSSQPPHTTTQHAPAPTHTGPPFTGPGFLHVYTGGSKKGCVISGGTWYVSGSCAGFTATEVPDGGFTLASRKGNCAILNGALTCGGSVTEASIFTAQGDVLAYGGNNTFYADGIPRGTKQGTLYTDEKHDTSLTIQWQGR